MAAVIFHIETQFNLPKGMFVALEIPFISSPNGNGTWSASGAYQFNQDPAVTTVTTMLPNLDQLMESMIH